MPLSRQEEGQVPSSVHASSRPLLEARETYLFGDYRLDSHHRRLWHHDTPVLLAPKALDLLHAFVQRPNQLITKEDLLRAVWPDSFVEEANLTVYVSALRKAFSKIDPQLDLIETIPRWGYRFTAHVSKDPLEPAPLQTALAAAPDTPALIRKQSEPLTLPAPLPSRGPALQLTWAAAALLFLIAAASLILLPRRMVKASTVLANSRALAASRPLTGPSGIFSQPAFSPDGSRLAYTWRKTTEDTPTLFTQSINSNDRTRITSIDGEDRSPAWSPDGHHLAYLHSEGDSSPMHVIVVDLANPSNRRSLATVSGFASAFRSTPTLSWSRHGEWLLTTDRANEDAAENDAPSLVLIDASTGKKHQLTHAPLRTVDDNAQFSPDGKLVAFRRSLGSSSDEIYVVPTSGGSAQRLAFEKHSSIDGLAWNPDSQSVIVSSGVATSVGSLWRIPIDGGSAVPITAPLVHTSSPAVSPQALRLAYVDRLRSISTWRMPLDTHAAAEPLIASSFLDSAADYSPDGTHIAFRSDRSGSNEIWISKADGAELRKLTSFAGPMTGSPRWSPDGRSIAFDSRTGGRADIYIVRATGSTPVRFTTAGASDSDNVVPSWSHDGRSIYFSSNRTGAWQIWRKTIGTDSESQITFDGGFNGVESSDGSSLYYVADTVRTSIWKISLDHPAQAQEIVKELGPGMWGYWAVLGNRMYYLQRPHTGASHAEIVRLNLENLHTEDLGATQYPVNPSDKGLAISPNGQWLLYAQRDVDRSNIMITDSWE